MAAVDEHVRQSLDVSNFKTLAADAGKPVANEAQIKAAHEATLREQIDRIRTFAKANPDDPLTQANQHLLLPRATATVDTWIAGPGNFSISSTYKWAIGGGVPFLGEAPLSFLFGGTGGSWAAWATGTQVILGSFVLDPNAICKSNEFHYAEQPGIGTVRKGPCNFTASGGGAGVSGVTISFYSTKGAFWGTLTGSGALIGYFSVEGELDLVWQGWK
jgi:hypothetical protein